MTREQRNLTPSAVAPPLAAGGSRTSLRGFAELALSLVLTLGSGVPAAAAGSLSGRVQVVTDGHGEHSLDCARVTVQSGFEVLADLRSRIKALGLEDTPEAVLLARIAAAGRDLERPSASQRAGATRPLRALVQDLRDLRLRSAIPDPAAHDLVTLAEALIAALDRPGCGGTDDPALRRRDGVEEDCDGLLDCTDPDCVSWCTELCQDRLDNDGDCLRDCRDRDDCGAPGGSSRSSATASTTIAMASPTALTRTAL